MAASPLCDAGTFTRQLEAVYRAMWRRWCFGGGDWPAAG
jgi:predicted O-linked N-acetylglucosamine transferase (SPINDLY family)